MGQNNPKYRVHLEFPRMVKECLEALGPLLDTRSKTEIFRRSVLFFHAVVSQVAKGGRFVLYDAEGRPITLIP